MRFENAEQGQLYVSFVIAETAALSPMKLSNSTFILWIACISLAGTPFFSREANKAAMEAFVFGRRWWFRYKPP